MKIGNQESAPAAKVKKVLESGRYPATIKGIYLNDSKSGNGKHIKILFKAEDAAVYNYMNVFHTNKVHEEIERKKLNNLRRCAGVYDALSLSSFEQDFSLDKIVKDLVGKEVNLIIEKEPAGQFPARNTVKAVQKR